MIKHIALTFPSHFLERNEGCYGRHIMCFCGCTMGDPFLSLKPSRKWLTSSKRFKTLFYHPAAGLLTVENYIHTNTRTHTFLFRENKNFSNTHSHFVSNVKQVTGFKQYILKIYAFFCNNL